MTYSQYIFIGGCGGVIIYLTSHPLSRTSARTRPLRRPRVAPYTFLPVRATNPLRLRFTLSPYLIPLNPQLPPWLLTEHDSLWIALVINNSPAVRSASPAAGHPRVPHWCVREATRCFSPLAFSFFGGGGCCRGGRYALFTSLLPRLASTSRLTHRRTPGFCPWSLRNFLREPMNRWGERDLHVFWVGLNNNNNNRSLHVGKRRPLCGTRGQQLIGWTGRVSGDRATHCRCAAGLALGQPGITRCLCPWRPGGHYSTRADCGETETGRRGERVAHNRRAHGFHGNNYWIIRLRPQLIWLTITHRQNKNVYRAAGRALGFFCFRYKAQLKN